MYKFCTRPIRKHLYSGIVKDPLGTKHKIFKCKIFMIFYVKYLDCVSVTNSVYFTFPTIPTTICKLLQKINLYIKDHGSRESFVKTAPSYQSSPAAVVWYILNVPMFCKYLLWFGITAENICCITFAVLPINNETAMKKKARHLIHGCLVLRRTLLDLYL